MYDKPNTETVKQMHLVHFKKTVASVYITVMVSSLLVFCVFQVRAENIWFNPSLLEVGDSTVDEKTVQRLAEGKLLPGAYLVDIYVNNMFIGKQDTVLTSDGPDESLTPAWSVNTLLGIGIKEDVLSENPQLNMSSEVRDRTVPGILNSLPGTHSRLDLGKQRLDVTIPSIFMNRNLAGATSPHLWDDGLSAGVVGYNFSASKTNSQSSSSVDNDSAFLSVNNKINLGPWRANNFSTWSYNSLAKSNDAQGKNERRVTQNWHAINTWIERPLPAVKGLLSIGDSYTSADVFNSVQFRGIQLASDTEMYPDILRTFAPVIRGTATSNARVTVRQNGSLVYETTVPPGQFAINDLSVSSLSGDLYVTVQEADGSIHTFVQGSSSQAIMQREGQLRYAMTAAKLRNSGANTREPEFLQVTGIYGLPYDITVYGGALGSENYQAASFGLGSVLGLAGALSTDVTVARANIFDAYTTGQTTNSTGQSWRLRYSKAVAETGTSLALAASRYSTDGYYSFSDANMLADASGFTTTFTPEGIITHALTTGRARQEMQLDLSQSLGNSLGSLGVNATRKTFWDIAGQQESVSANWNFTLKDVGIGMMWQRTRWPESHRKDDSMVSMMVTVPLSRWLYGAYNRNSLYATSSLSQNQDALKTFSNGVSGTILDDNRLALNARQTTVHGGDASFSRSSKDLSAAYSGRAAIISGGYSQTSEARQLNLGLQGAIVATKYGVTAGQNPGQTIGLIHVPDAAGIRVKSGTGIATDSWGNALVSAQPYRRNRYDLDVLSAAQNVTLTDTSVEVIPSRGAVVAAVYNTTVGHQVLMTLTRSGRPVPFGSVVTIVSGKGDMNESLAHSVPGGVVGDGGQAWLTGMPERGTLKVTWDEGTTGSCLIDFALSPGSILTAENQNLPVQAKGECP
ncbi:fimbria/pilus outer membrane usher protein [Enterobacter ludwigii]|uniref:fimbria/pilus outer membrane usher protein n=1 Tax=Enterobacter ludwigii TaxID=299767 RepID=UPI002A7FFFD9|nr:fimbria/pilus outer membrane usher protein [Enterobacter ludwigii]